MPVNNSVVVVDCAPPSPSVANGRVVGYRVQYCPCSGNTCMDTAKEVSSASTRIWIGNLRGQTMYCLRAAAFTKVGMGPWTKQITALTNMEGEFTCSSQTEQMQASATVSPLYMKEATVSSNVLCSYLCVFTCVRSQGPIHGLNPTPHLALNSLSMSALLSRVWGWVLLDAVWHARFLSSKY